MTKTTYSFKCKTTSETIYLHKLSRVLYPEYSEKRRTKFVKDHRGVFNKENFSSTIDITITVEDYHEDGYDMVHVRINDTLVFADKAPILSYKFKHCGTLFIRNGKASFLIYILRKKYSDAIFKIFDSFIPTKQSCVRLCAKYFL